MNYLFSLIIFSLGLISYGSSDSEFFDCQSSSDGGDIFFDCLTDDQGSSNDELSLVSSRKRALVLGAGDEASGNRWRAFFRDGNTYDWQSADLCREFQECIQLNFNNAQELNALPNNYYDLILFDRSTVKFLEWTYEFFFIIKQKLKMEGKFYLPLEMKGGAYEFAPLNKRFKTRNDAKKWIKNDLIENQMTHLYSNSFIPTLNKKIYTDFSFGNNYETVPGRELKDFSLDNHDLNSELYRIFNEIFAMLYGACEQFSEGVHYEGPDETKESIKQFLVMTKTKEHNPTCADLELGSIAHRLEGRDYDAFVTYVHKVIRKSPVFGALPNGLVQFKKNNDENF